MTLTLAPPMPPTTRRPLPRHAGGGRVPMPPGKALPRFEEGGATPPAPKEKGKPSSVLYRNSGRFWVWDGGQWHDVGPVGAEGIDTEAIAAARKKADAILAGGAASAATPATAPSTTVPAASTAAPTAWTPQTVADYIRKRAKEYAAQQGAPQFGDVFAQNAIAIAWGESSLGQADGGDNGLARGVYQLYFGQGSTDASGRKRGLTMQQAADPKLNIDASMPELWQGFVAAGQKYDFSKTPQEFFIEMWRKAQRPSEQALATHGRSVAPQALAIGAGGATIPQSVAGNGGAQGGTGGATRTVDPALQAEFDAVNTMLTAQRERYNTLLSKPNKSGDELLEMVNLEKSLPIIRAQWMDLYKAIQPGSSESPTSQALAQSTIAQNNVEMWGARQGAITNILGALRQMTTDAFGAKKDEANFLLDILTTSFNQAAKVNELAVQRGQLDLNGYIALTEAQALQQTAEAARAMKAMELAGAINANDWALAERALPAGTHYQPMFGPNDPLPSIMRQMGLGDATMRAAPIDTAKLDLRNTLRETPGLLDQLGYARPNFAVDKVAAQVEANKDIPQFTAQPVQPQNFASVWPKAPTSDYDTLTQFLNMQMSEVQGYDPFAQPNVTQLTNPVATTGGGAGNTQTPLTIRTQLDLPTTATSTVAGYTFNPATNQFIPPRAPNTTTANSFTGGASGAVPPAWTNPGGTGAAAKPQAPYPATSTGWGGAWGIPGPAGLGWEIDPQTGQLRRKAGT